MSSYDVQEGERDPQDDLRALLLGRVRDTGCSAWPTYPLYSLVLPVQKRASCGDFWIPGFFFLRSRVALAPNASEIEIEKRAPLTLGFLGDSIELHNRA